LYGFIKQSIFVSLLLFAINYLKIYNIFILSDPVVNVIFGLDLESNSFCIFSKDIQQKYEKLIEPKIIDGTYGI
jgi:hypothetical protein